MDGISDITLVANHLAAGFEKNCQPNSNTADLAFKKEFYDKIQDYKVPLHTSNFNINNLALVIEVMKTGKSPGADGLTIEHFSCAHPSVTLTLKYLFDIILSTGFVPDGFGNGITIPIPKDKNKINGLTKEDFRPITINPIVSKIFECCLFDLISAHLDTNERQFGFKRGTGCVKAIYSVKKPSNFL